MPKVNLDGNNHGISACYSDVDNCKYMYVDWRGICMDMKYNLAKLIVGVGNIWLYII